MTATSTAGRLVRRHLRFERSFVQVPNAWVRDTRLSWRARGILVSLMSHEPGWSVTVKTLAAEAAQGHARSTDGIASVRGAVQELERYGYLQREQKRDRSGRLSHTEWAICDPHDPVDNSGTSAPLAETGVESYPQDIDPEFTESPDQDRDAINRQRLEPSTVGTVVGESHDIRTPFSKNTFSSHVPEVTTEARTASAQEWPEVDMPCRGNRATGRHDFHPLTGWCDNACGVRLPEPAPVHA